MVRFIRSTWPLSGCNSRRQTHSSPDDPRIYRSRAHAKTDDPEDNVAHALRAGEARAGVCGARARTLPCGRFAERVCDAGRALGGEMSSLTSIALAV
jgi:hypothetical protein